MGTRRVVALVTSAHLPAGLLTDAAWRLARTHGVFAAAPSATVTALGEAGVVVALEPAVSADSAGLARLLDLTDAQVAVRLTDPDEVSALLAAARSRGVTLEVCHGSWDPPGTRLLEVVAVMDRMVSPGGDEWKRQQTHQTLARYLLEESYEAIDAIDAHDLDALREELGDVLLQVVLHARLAQETDGGWTIDDLATELTDKLVRRNPHVFAGVEVSGVDEITENWERIKRVEKGRMSIMDGIALGQPALALAEKIISRVRRADAVLPEPPATDVSDLIDRAVVDDATLGATLLALVAAGHERGLNAEAALRRVALAYAATVRGVEAG